MHFNLIILTDFHSFTVNEEKLQKWSIFKFSANVQDAILVKIWKWLKLLYSVPFIKKRLLNHVYIRIWSSSLTFTISQGMKANIKISQFSRFLLGSEYVIQVKIWKWLKLLNSVPFIKKRLLNQVYIRIDHLHWLSQFHREWRQTSKLFNFQDFC